MTWETIDKEIMEKIRSGQINMKSRRYFLVRAILLGLAVFIFLSVGILTVSFLLFSLHASGAWRLPEFGGRGWVNFLIYFPWIIAALAIGFIFLLEWYVKHYSFVYRQPVLYSVSIIIILLIAGGWFVHQTSLHAKLYEYAKQDRLMFLGPIYRGRMLFPPGSEYVGTLIEENGNNYVFSSNNGQIYRVLIGPETNRDLVSVGDDCIIFGKASSTEISAFGIRKIDPEDRYPLRPPPQFGPK